MKKIILIFLIIILIAFCSCSTKANNNWSEKDFAFYNNGKAKLFSTIDDYWIHLSDNDNLATYRDIKIGDSYQDIIHKYNLKDFEWSICDFTYLNPSTDKSEALEKIYKEQDKNVIDILNNINAIASNNLDIYIYCDIYKQNGELCTYSQLDFSELKSEEYIKYEDKYREMLFKQHHLKYTISFSIDGEKISDVSIESNYHNWLSVAYNTKGELIKGYEWIKDLK